MYFESRSAVLRILGVCIKIKNTSWQILQNGIFVYLNDIEKHWTRFSRKVYFGDGWHDSVKATEWI